MGVFRDLLAILITAFVVLLILGAFISIGFGIGYFSGLVIHYIFNIDVVFNKPTETVFGLLGVVIILISIFIKR